ncbi:hypothetical protein [Novosphingobium sp. TCA1]|jgi:hypothetical protein|uniref:hypothetical protein n=1 Tax=Novosphingobium sp. TCA1 TaxID=2682474 RepID=UPI00130B9B74|nr:hypothetical protein [Novosphingobium sp. TCA1]GFE72363.1 hypothetical protein NTCA1_00120 [Novosphingobium sp. TCA1]
MKKNVKQGYKKQRAHEYPSWEEQMDYLFHHGYDAWKALIQSIKDKYPKDGSALSGE